MDPLQMLYSILMIKIIAILYKTMDFLKKATNISKSTSSSRIIDSKTFILLQNITKKSYMMIKVNTFIAFLNVTQVFKKGCIWLYLNRECHLDRTDWSKERLIYSQTSLVLKYLAAWGKGHREK